MGRGFRKVGPRGGRWGSDARPRRNNFSHSRESTRMNSAIRGAALACSALILVSGTALAAPPPDQVDKSILAHARLIMDGRAPNLNAFADAFAPAVAGVDTVPNFQGSFNARGVDFFGHPQFSWPWDMLGNAPAAGGTTTVGSRRVAQHIPRPAEL